jgi:hypothetical protein
MSYNDSLQLIQESRWTQPWMICAPSQSVACSQRSLVCYALWPPPIPHAGSPFPLRPSTCMTRHTLTNSDNSPTRHSYHRTHAEHHRDRLSYRAAPIQQAYPRIDHGGPSRIIGHHSRWDRAGLIHTTQSPCPASTKWSRTWKEPNPANVGGVEATKLPRGKLGILRILGGSTWHGHAHQQHHTCKWLPEAVRLHVINHRLEGRGWV